MGLHGEEASDGDVVAARAGDEAAFARLFRATQPGLLRYARVLAGDDAEDVCAEAWSQACGSLPQFEGDLDAFRGWVARIVRNRAIDLHRARRRRPFDPVAPEDLPEPGADRSSEEVVLEAFSSEEAIAAISRLPREQAEAVMLRAVLGFDVNTTATVLGKRPGAVRVAAHRGLRKLADQYEPPIRE
jgi:RNA polymerase sigma-70 factor, ECF subfamily